MGDSNIPAAMMAGQAKVKALISYSKSLESILNGSRPKMGTCCRGGGSGVGVGIFSPGGRGVRPINHRG